MAVSYKGLTIKFGGDTSDLQKKLGEIQKTARNTNADLRAINQSLKFNPGNTDLLNQKVRNLSQAISDTSNKLKAYKAGLAELDEEARTNGGLTVEQQRQYDALQRDVMRCENQLESYTEQLKRTETEYEASKTKLYQWGQTLEDNSDKFKAIGDRMQSIGGAFTKYVTGPLAGIGVAAGKAAFDVDEALTGVRKTVDATEEEYEGLKNAAIAYSETHPISATDILAAEELAGQLGVDKENLQQFAEVATGLDLATNMNVDQAATNLARFANVTNMSKLEGEDAERAYRSYGNVIVGLGNNLATTESEVSDFSLRMASAGTQAGMTEADILGIAGAMSSVGLEAQAGGSAFSKTITDISVAVATGSDDLEKYANVAGTSAEEFATYWQEDATHAFTDFINGLANGSDDMNVVLEGLGITELRQSDALRRLAGNTDLLTNAVQLANDEWSDGAALADEVAAKGDSVGGKLQTLKNKIQGVLEKIGEPLLDALTSAIDAAEPFLQTVGNMAQAFADMEPQQQQFILGLAGAAAAFGPVTSGLGGLIGNLGNVGTGMKDAATFVTGLKEKFGGFGAKIGEVGGLLSGKLSGGWSAFTGLIAAHPIALGVAAVAAAVAGLTWFFTQTETGKKMWADFTGWLSEKWQGVQDFFAGIPAFWGGVWDSVTGKVNDVKNSIGTAWDNMKSAASGAWDKIKSTIGGAWDNIKNKVSTTVGNLKSKVGTAWENMKSAASEKWNAIKSAIGIAWDNIKSKATGTAGNIRSAVGNAWDNLKANTSNAWGNIKANTSNAWGSVKDLITKDMSAAHTAGSKSASALKAALSGDWATAKSDAQAAFEAIKSRISDRMNLARDTVKTVGNTIGSVLGFPGLGDRVAGVFDSIKSKISEKINAAKDAVSNAIERIKGFFNFSWSLPHLRLPHPTISGHFSLDPPSVPHFGIEWYKKGGVIAPNNPHLIGVGDAREREWIEPESKLLGLIEGAMRNVGGGTPAQVSVEVNVSANITGRQSSYEVGQDIGRGISSVMKQRGYSYA